MSDSAEKIKNAITEGDIESLRKLVTKEMVLGQNLESGFLNNRFTVLHYATMRQQSSIVNFLLNESRMDPNIRDGHGVVPLYDLVRGKESESALLCFNFLKDAGADINSVTENSWRMSLIEAAVFSKNLTMIKALLDAGADPNPDTVKINGKKGNLIHLAVSEYCHLFGSDNQKKCIDIINVLVSNLREGSINERMDEKYTPLDIAEMEGEKTFVNGKPRPEDDNYEHIQKIINFLINSGGRSNRSELPVVPLRDQVTLNENMSKEEINLMKNYAYSLALVVDALSMLIEEKKEGGGMHAEYRRVAAFACKDMHETIEKIDASRGSCSINMGHEIFNALHAIWAMENMMDANYEVTNMDEKTLVDIRGDLHGIQSDLNVYDHTYC